MYSPYDNYIDKAQQDLRINDDWSSKENYFMPGRIMAGLAVAGMGVMGVGAMGTATRMAHNSAMKNRPGYAKFVDKASQSKLYKSMLNPLSAMGTAVPWFRKANSTDAMFSPLREAGIPGFGELISKKVPFASGLPGQGRYVMKLPMMMPGAFLMGAISGVSESGHASGLPLGIAKTGMSFAGMAAGQTMGAMLGSAVLPVIGTAIGALAGGAIGGLAGDSVIDTVKWLKSKGRQWGHPELGGGFKDSSMGQTMRARSLNAIQTSQFNVRSNLGNEAVRLTMGY
jgi:hypothetical protein